MAKLCSSLLTVFFMLLQLSVDAYGSEENQDDPVQYGKDCASLIAEAPPFNCLAGRLSGSR